jgi:nicotinate-nucleotide adenylyltransferase
VKLALFGGTFDPVHAGHLAMARAAADAFALDRILFVPSGRPPHKQGRAHAGYSDRLRMVELACAADPRFEASRLEDPAERGDGPSYSYETIRRVRETMAPGDELFFLLGEDAFADLAIWRRLEDVWPLVEFLVVSRPDSDVYADLPHPAIRARRLSGVFHPASSTEIRRRAAAGEPLAGLAPPEVEEYIRERGLYRTA